MGIEYRHFIVVNDAYWRPESDTVERVEAVLRDWSLIGDAAKVVDLCSGPNRNTSSSPGRGIALVYPGATGVVVETVAGPSAYAGISSDERYLKRTTLVLGDDYRVQWGSESIYFELKAAPLAGGEPIAGEDDDPYDALFSASFPSDRASSPPVVVARIEAHAKPSIGWDSCLGFWRGALVLDFGKDLPAFSDRVHALPAREFVSALSAAIRGPLVEIGEFY